MCWIAILLVAVGSGSGRVITSSSRCRKQWNRVVSVRFPRPWDMDCWAMLLLRASDRADTRRRPKLLPRPTGGRSVRGAASRDGLSFARGVAWTAIPAPVAGTMRKPLVVRCLADFISSKCWALNVVVESCSRSIGHGRVASRIQGVL